MKSFICLSVCHAPLLILPFSLLIFCSFFLSPCFFTLFSFFSFSLLLYVFMWPLSHLPSSFFLSLTSPPHSLCLSTDCQFEIGGWDGIIRSSQVEEEERVKPGDALDCIWTIRAPPQSKVSTGDCISIQEWWHTLLLSYPSTHLWYFQISSIYSEFKIAMI